MKNQKIPNTQPPSSNRDIFDRLLYPFYGRFAAHIPKAVHPNIITLCAITSSLSAAGMFAFYSTTEAYFYCTVLILCWCVLDSLDGIHARNTGQCSNLGGFLDHVGDSVGLLAMHLAFVYRLEIHDPVLVGALLLRQAMNGWVFLIQVYTGKLYLPSTGSSFELYTLMLLMLTKFFFPDLVFSIGTLPQHDLIGNATLIYYLAVPSSLAEIGYTVYLAHKKIRHQP
jgi:phosphatidylglycerophosphate synthase